MRLAIDVRFGSLNLHYRAAYRILRRTDALLVDFHNQRLHSVIPKPYDSESSRVHRAIAIGQLVIDVLAGIAAETDELPAQMRIGIDSGKTLAVNNGRRGHREPLFLGEAANRAAKRATGGIATGIYLTNKARAVIGLQAAADEDNRALTSEEIARSQGQAKLDVDCEDIVHEWREEMEEHPPGEFYFSGHIPPFKDLDFESLSVANSRRQDAATLYADLDGFTSYVSRKSGTDDGARQVVKVLHVLRSELDAALHEDFSGRKVRFIGDCVHGLAAEGTAQTTDAEETVTTMALCAGGLRSSFGLVLTKLTQSGCDTTGLGLQIGFEYGPMTATRLGVKGDLIRCSVSRGVLVAEREQLRCSGNETAIGATAYARGTDGVRAVFGVGRKRKDLDYQTVLNELAGKGDKTAGRAKQAEGAGLLRPAAAVVPPLTFPNCPTGPAKPAGFA